MQNIINILTKIGLFSCLVWITAEKSVLAQSSNIIPDDTLKSESSLVEQNFLDLPIELIQGGAIRGANLFHSFREFNVSEGRSAYFLNPSADIQNIVARVTGKKPSEIFGILGTLDESNYFFSKANLFLINPNGIIFGRNASLNTAGSFVATTADAVQFNNQGLFSTSTPEVPQLLTVNPSAFLFNQIQPAPIINQSRIINISSTSPTGISTRYGKSLLLLGGDVILDGGVLTAFGGKVELGGLAQKGSVGLNIDGDNLDLIFPADAIKADIYLTKQAIISTPGLSGGEIQLAGNNITINGQSGITSATTGNQNGRHITIQASQLNISQDSTIRTITTASGKGGDIIINTQNLDIFEILGNLGIITFTSNSGNSGNIFINTENLNMNLGSIGSVTVGAQGNAGNISISANNSVNLNAGIINTVAFGFGNLNAQGSGGNLLIEAKTLNAENISAIATYSLLGQGNPGDLTLKIADYINLSNSRVFATSFSAASGGDINIETGTLNILDGTQIINNSVDPFSPDFLKILPDDITNDSVTQQRFFIAELQDIINRTGRSNNFGQFNSGNINIRATNSVVMNGISTFRETRNVISTETQGAGKAGTLTLETGELIAGDGSVISTQSTSSGDGSNLIIKADAVKLTDNAQIVALSEGTGKAGNINLNVVRNLNATNSNISTSSLESSGGTINISAENIRLFGDSDIRTNVFSGAGGGGNITLTANSIIALDDSDILSFALDGKGGDIRFNTRAFLSSPLYRSTSLKSDVATINTLEGNQQVEVNASGAISGTITGVPDISFLQNSLTELPQNIIDTNALLANSCIARRNNQQGGTFFVTGSGGLPERPGDAPLSTYSTGVIQSVPTTNANRPRWKIGDAIVEPQGIYRLSNGKRVLGRECS
jgi:filamentous hemagglutinin family protein